MGWVGGPENDNFPLLYVVKMSLHRWVVQKSLKRPLSNIKMAPYVHPLFWDPELSRMHLHPQIQVPNALDEQG